MARKSLSGPTGDGVALERVVLAGNGQSGWNMDKGDENNGTGNLTLDRFPLLWNGSAGEYPIVEAQPYNYCTDDTPGGYGGGLGMATTRNNPAWHGTIGGWPTSIALTQGVHPTPIQFRVGEVIGDLGRPPTEDPKMEILVRTQKDMDYYVR